MNDAARRSAAAADAPRFELCAKIASGGMGSVYVARARGALGFANLVAVKRPHAHLLEAPAFKRSLFEEATLSSYVRHPNVVGIRDVVMDGPNLYLVMDYIEGASLAQLLTAAGGTQLPLGVALRIALDACVGLHAAHEAVDAGGRALGIVHRDVSPANVLVGVDGVSRISDFGIAKSMSKVVDQETTQGLLKGKLAYMAPEQVQGRPIDRRTDVFALGAVLWELVAGRRLFRGDNDAVTLANVLMLEPPSLARLRAKLPRGLDDAIRWALAKAPDARPASVEVLAEAIERASAGHVGPVREVRQVVLDLFGDDLAKRRANVLACASEDEPPPTAPTPGSATLVGPDATVRSPDTPEGAVAPLDRRITLRLESAPAPAASRAPATVPLPTVPLLVAPAPPRAVEAVTASIGVRRGRAVSWLVVALVGATLGTAAFGAAVLRHRRASVSVVSAPPESSPPRAPSAVSVEEPSEAPPSVSAAASAAAPASPSASVASPSPLVSSAPPPRLAAPPSASSARPTRRTPAPPAATHLVAPPNPYGAATGGT